MTEKQVENAVEAYLLGLSTQQSFSIQRQMRIQIGSGYGIVDLALCCDFPFQILAIIECKKSGFTGDLGIEQLQSYLCATDTDLGIFATTGNPQDWDYCLNLGQNTFKSITHSEFLLKICSKDLWITARQKRIRERANQRVEEEVKRRVTQTQIDTRTELYIKEEAKKRITEDKIESCAARELYEKVKQQAQEIDELREVRDKHFGCAVFGWIVVIMIILILIWG